jgi:hypothetical protein
MVRSICRRMNANGAPERRRPDTLNAVTVNQAFWNALRELASPGVALATGSAITGSKATNAFR